MSKGSIENPPSLPRAWGYWSRSWIRIVSSTVVVAQCGGYENCKRAKASPAFPKTCAKGSARSSAARSPDGPALEPLPAAIPPPKGRKCYEPRASVGAGAFIL